MRRGFAVLVGILLFLVVALLVGPILLQLLQGGHP